MELESFIPSVTANPIISGCSAWMVLPESSSPILKSEFIRDFDYSYDGKQIAIIRGHREADVVLICHSEKVIVLVPALGSVGAPDDVHPRKSSWTWCSTDPPYKLEWQQLAYAL